MSLFVPEKILIEASVLDLPLTRQILKQCPDTPHETIGEAKELIKSFQTQTVPGVYEKKTLLIAKNKGRFLDLCPGTKKYFCCGYMILTPGMGCPLDCSYCVLQAYLNNPFVTLYANLQDMIDELESSPAFAGGGIVRIGTGEFMDSLALDHLTDFASFILPFFRKRKGSILELKTKTTNIDRLLGLDHHGAFIISWSLNTEEIIGHEEKNTASLQDRISAARRLTEKGYRVGFHFDPVICYPGWEAGYEKVIRMLGEQIPPASIAWISIGSLRYMPALKPVGQKRFPGTKIYSREFVPGLDGKMRYLQSMRIEIYGKMISWLRAYLKDVFIYFCMENSVVWNKSMGFSPSSNGELKKLLDERVEVD